MEYSFLFYLIFFFYISNTVDRFNTTPLQNAIDGGHEEVVVLLSDAGAVLGASMLGEFCLCSFQIFFYFLSSKMSNLTYMNFVHGILFFSFFFFYFFF